MATTLPATAPRPARPRFTARQTAALAVLVLPVLLISIDMTVLGFAVPFLSEDLAPTSSQLLWIVDVYGFVLAGLLVTMGSLADRIGRRRLLLIGVAAFAVASLIAAYAPTAEALIAARVLLGLAGATLMPTTLALMRNLFTDERQRLLAIAIWGAGFSAGAALGPVLGGWLLEHYWWGSVFLMAVPVTLFVLATAPRLLPESRNPEPGPLDWIGVVLSFSAMLPFVYGVKSLASHGLSVVAVAALLAGIGFGWAFIRRQRRLEHPLIDVGLFRLRRFSASVATNFTIVFGMISALYFLTQYLQLVLGYSPMRAGLLLVPGLTLSIAAGLVAVRLSEHLGLVQVIVGGLLFITAGFAVLPMVSVDSGAVIVMASFLAIGIGTGMVQTVTNAAIMTAAPPHRAGAAAAISETAYELGGALGVAVLGSVAAGVYRSHLPDAPGMARETLGSALDTAATLPTAAGAALETAARTAFTTGLRTTSVIAAVLLVIAALAVARALRVPKAEPVAVKG
jgi:MFS transporter, DHA2 family, multidrug resistance protein